jgi:16S rRNA (uracil1498-N3)-methyltransferase
MEGLSPGNVVLDEAAARYVTRVHRLGPGDRFVGFDPEARLEAEVEITAAARSVAVLVGPLSEATAVARSGVWLLQALGKGDKPERVLRDATALGVEHVLFVETRRAVVRVEGDGRARARRWHAIAVDAARQSGRGDVPDVPAPCSLEEAFARLPAGARRVCLVPGAESLLGAVLDAWTPGEPLAVLVGPEGGLDSAEIAAARAAGFVAVRFGSFVLRTETAAVAVLGAIAARGTPGAPG